MNSQHDSSVHFIFMHISQVFSFLSCPCLLSLFISFLDFSIFNFFIASIISSACISLTSLIFSLIFMYLTGLFSFCLKRKHLLLMLLSLEFVVISLYLGLFLCFGMFNWEYYFVLVFLTMSVRESAFGLSLLVLLMQTYGNDYLQSFSLLW